MRCNMRERASLMKITCVQEEEEEEETKRGA
jgi:hypothetical protein